MIYPKFLYSTLLRDVTPTFSGTTLSGKPPANATDLLDWSYFTADTGNLDFNMTEDTDIDAVAIYVASGSGTNSIELQYESSPSTYTSLKTFSAPTGTLDIEEFTGVTVLSGRNIRFVITATTTIDIRQLMVGEILTAEQGQWVSASPPAFNSGVKVTNNISQNGSVLGRSIKRLERMGKIQLDWLTDSWVRSDWEPFSAHFARHPFFYQWDPTGHPTDVAFAFAERIDAPKHSENGYLSVTIPIRMLVADSESI